MSTLPDFRMDVPGWYGGNAYPETREYRVTIHAVDDEVWRLAAEDSGGFEVGSTVITAALADGIIDMANRDHDLTGFEDDWELPAGMVRTLSWSLPTDDTDIDIVLQQHHIDEVAGWLRFATGVETYDGNPDEWEY